MTTNPSRTITELAQAAKAAAPFLATASAVQKNQALHAMAAALKNHSAAIIAENQKDLAAARANGLSAALIDRLTLTEQTLADMAQGLSEVADLPDPVGTTSASWLRPNGLEVARRRIPLGVIGIIYESRPNVTVDAAGLCLKSGNAVILRGGSEALYSNRALAETISRALADCDFPAAAVQVVPTTDRAAVDELLQQESYLDLIIPRGGEGLIRHVVTHSTIPVLKHYKGVCHVYVDAAADMDMARDICFNAKVQRPGVCNAMETMLVHQQVAERFLPAMAEQFERAGVTLRGCEQTRQLVPGAEAATEDDWPAEYLDLILAVKVVPDMQAAWEHIARYGSAHTEAIVTTDYQRARQFQAAVDASVVLVNASTRFNDGGQLGLGAEMGISTSKLHAFGPMGLEELTTTKFIVNGDGQIRQ